jgi:hypothetical protein
MANDQVIPEQCEGGLTARLQNPTERKIVVEPSPEAHTPEGLYILGTLVHGRQEVSLGFLNATCRERKLKKRPP